MHPRAQYRDLLLAGGAGAAAAFLLDRESGKRRRARLYDRGTHGLHVARRSVVVGISDLSQRLKGATARLARVGEGPPPDETLARRVRARIGRVGGHPHAIIVEADRGRVSLKGDILAADVDPLIQAIRSVPGVRQVVNELAVHLQAQEAPVLNGPPRRLRSPRPGYWPPGKRLLAGAAGGVLAAVGVSRRDARLGLIGAGLITRAGANRSWSELVGLDRRHGIELRKTLDVDASPEQVFAFLDEVANLSRFMSHLRRVRDLGDGRSEWVLAGPAGLTLAWTAVRFLRVPNQLLAWASVPGALLGNATWVHFEPRAEGGTRLEIHLTYSPPGGTLGYLLGRLVGIDPKGSLDRDLIRFKSLMEVGKTSLHGHVELNENAPAAEEPVLH